MNAKSYLFYFLLSMMMLIISGCGEDNTSETKELSNPWNKELFFGVIPIESEERTYERYARFMKYMEKELGSKITLVVPENYAAVINSLTEKKLDFALLGPKTYIESTKHADVEVVVRVVGEDGQDGYKGLIITKKGSGLKTIADLKGKTWAFTDPNSTSGTLIPTVYFAAQAHIEPEKYFSKVIFSGSHAKSILMVKNGEIDAASTNNVSMGRDSGRDWNNEDFNIVWESQLIPHDMIVYQRSLSDKFKHAFEKAAVAYNDEQGLKDMAVSKLIPATDEDYVFIRKLNDFKEKLQQQKAE